MYSRKCNHFYSTPLTNPKRPVPELGFYSDCSFRTRGWYSICRVSGVRFPIFVVTGAIGIIHLRVSSDSSCRMFGRPVLYSCTSCYRDPMVRLCTPILLVQSRVSLPFLTAPPVHHTLVITFALPVICFAFACCILLFVVDFWVSPEVPTQPHIPLRLFAVILCISNQCHFDPFACRA